jgi:hypothetical protein
MYAARRSAQWGGVAPVMAATLRNYPDQIALTLRPSTVTRAEAILREFACFLRISAPELGRIADVRRSHIEAFKRYLANRPAVRPGRNGAAGAQPRCDSRLSQGSRYGVRTSGRVGR